VADTRLGADGTPTPGLAEPCDLRTRVGGFEAHLAFRVPPDELDSLVTALARPRDSFAPTAVLGGRASVWRHQIPSVGPVVIKEFRRGGMLRVFRRRHYLRMGDTRPDREFAALRRARAAGVHAPEAVATFVRGGLFYRGWLVTRFVEGRSLVALSAETPARIEALMDQITWQVMLLIRHHIAHVDLHPGNVLVDGNGVAFFVDFDRAVTFEGTPEDLRDLYHTRWCRAVEKHALPAELKAAFTRGLFDRPSCSLACTEDACGACDSRWFSARLHAG
jgi:3-deoxy-D-manno-octulosonic acid kinase